MARAWWLLLAMALYPRVCLADGLRKVDSATTGGSRSVSSSSSSSSRSSYSTDYDDYGGESEGCGLTGQASCDPRDSFWFWVFTFTIGSPWSIPLMFWDDPTIVRFAPYPFADGPGLLRRPLPDGEEGGRKFAVALDAESGYMLQGVVPSGLALRVLMPYRLELDARFSGLSDVRENPVLLASAGTAHLTYRFAQGRRYDFRTGFGVRTFTLDAPRVGFDLLYGIDTYLGPCIVWRIELHLGSAGDAMVTQARSTVGAMISRFELYAGYDHTGYFSERNNAALGGPIAGVRAWF